MDQEELAPKEDNDFAKPILENGRYANPKSFKNWKDLPGLGALIRWRRETSHAKIPSTEQVG